MTPQASRDRETRTGSTMVKTSPRKNSAGSSDVSAADKKKSASSHKGSSKKPVEAEVPQSEHLWVGNVSSTLTEDKLAEQFSRYGEIDRLEIQSAKNFAFVSFKTVEDAVYAKRGLHGENLGGLAIRIEFAKGDRKREDFRQLDGNITSEEPLSEPPWLSSEKSKGNKDGDPSEVLWVGFPLHLKMDEKKLRRVFGSFGGIEKITTFPGRTYAFVKFESVKAACRAKEGVHQGKLFNDPRVNVTFAKSEVGPVDRGGTTSTLVSPGSPFKVDVDAMNSLSGGKLADDLRHDRYGDHNEATIAGSGISFNEGKHFLNHGLDKEQPHMDLGGDVRKTLGMEHMELAPTSSPTVNTLVFPQKRYESADDKWSIEEEAPMFKKTRVDERHFHDDVLNELKSSKHIVHRSTFSVVQSHDRFSRDMNFTLDSSKREVSQVFSSIDGLRNHDGHSQERLNLQGSLSIHPNGPHLTGAPGNQQLELFRWEGSIAKGGNLVCHARCFPAKRSIGVTFPEVLDCTARTNLDMLANHITQVGDFSIVLFMPQGEMDVAPYQEFMGYLSEKQRAAVCKVSEEATLFLVPPLDFVEQFLKVPKSKNIFGVIIKAQGQQHQKLTGQTGLLNFLENQASMTLDDFAEDNYRKPALHSTSKHLTDSMSLSLPSSTMQPLEMINLSRSRTHPANFPLFTSVGINSPPTGPHPPVESLLSVSKPLGVVDSARHGYQSQESPFRTHEQMNTYHSNGPVPPPLPEMHSNRGILSQPSLLSPRGQLGSMDQHSVSVSQLHDQMKSSVPSILGARPYHLQSQLHPPPLPPHLQQALSREPRPPPADAPSKDSLLGQHGFARQQAPSSSVTSEASPSNTSGLQGKVAVDAEQGEPMQKDHERSSGDSLANLESEEDNKRFQATLELAAALLQQLRQQTKS